MPATTTMSERIDHWIKMRRFLALATRGRTPRTFGLCHEGTPGKDRCSRRTWRVTGRAANNIRQLSALARGKFLTVAAGATLNSGSRNNLVSHVQNVSDTDVQFCLVFRTAIFLVVMVAANHLNVSRRRMA